MPTLTWRGKDAGLNHHLDVPYRLLRCEPELSSEWVTEDRLPGLL